MNFVDKYWWIYNHPKLRGPEYGSVWIEIEPHMVCPETNRIEDDDSLNTKVQYWVECGGTCIDEFLGGVSQYHDCDLDCGGDTYEEAVERLYELVLTHYDDYEE